MTKTEGYQSKIEYTTYIISNNGKLTIPYDNIIKVMGLSKDDVVTINIKQADGNVYAISTVHEW